MTETWRLLVDPPSSGARNMALDEAILRAVAAGDAPPTLRFYAWQPACLSLGYGQPGTDVDRARLAERGWDVVRRLTGGRAILHADELTYGVALPGTHSLAAGTILDSYRRLSGALLDGLRSLSLIAHADARAEDSPKLNGPVCFEVPSAYEITAQGKKLIGSAQVRKFGGVLQHGSLPLTGDLGRIAEVLSFADESARIDAQNRVQERAFTVSDATGYSVNWDAAARAIGAAFAARFDLTFERATLTSVEQDQAAQFETRYRGAAWTFRL